VNLISAAVLLVFNIAIGLVAMVFLNVVILIVNFWQLQRLRAAPMQQKGGARTAAMLGTPAKAFSLQGSESDAMTTIFAGVTTGRPKESVPCDGFHRARSLRWSMRRRNTTSARAIAAS
jgi:hypothetical protein